MVIAGAGGHAMEVLDVLSSNRMDSNLSFYDDFNKNTIFQKTYAVIKNQAELKLELSKDSRFILGVGDGRTRKQFYDMFTLHKGIPFQVIAKSAIISNYANLDQTDVFNFCFVGANVVTGTGTLINAGSQVHHEVKIGRFTSINPGTQLLGKSKVGDFCSIGAGAIVLPNVTVGNNVTIGAGTIVTKNVPDNCTVVGVPGRVIKNNRDS